MTSRGSASTITQDDLARLAGVTRLTVRRALEGRRGVGDATRDRIRELARRHGYRPNVAARATRSGRLGSIDLLVSNLRGGVSRIPFGLLEGIHDAMSRHNLHLTLSQVADKKLTDPQYMPKILREFMADGVLINYTFNFPPPMLELIEQHHIPAVWLNIDLPHDSIRPDDREAGRLAAEHLIRAGHRRIGFVKLSGGGHHSERLRVEGYTAAMNAAGLHASAENLGSRQFHLIEEGGFNQDERLGLMRDYLRRSRDLTGVVAYTQACADVLCLAAALEGIRVPEDLSVVTIADKVVATAGQAITTVTLGWRAIGDTSVEMLIQKIETPQTKLPARVTPVAIEPGVSVARPRPSERA